VDEDLGQYVIEYRGRRTVSYQAYATYAAA